MFPVMCLTPRWRPLWGSGSENVQAKGQTRHSGTGARKSNGPSDVCSPLQNVPPDLAICCFILEQSLSVRALQEMLANTVEAGVEVRLCPQGAGDRDKDG